MLVECVTGVNNSNGVSQLDNRAAVECFHSITAFGTENSLTSYFFKHNKPEAPHGGFSLSRLFWSLIPAQAAQGRKPRGLGGSQRLRRMREQKRELTFIVWDYVESGPKIKKPRQK